MYTTSNDNTEPRKETKRKTGRSKKNKQTNNSPESQTILTFKGSLKLKRIKKLIKRKPKRYYKSYNFNLAESPTEKKKNKNQLH